MKVWLLLISSILLLGASIPNSTKQLIVVETSNWKANHGTLQRYTKSKKGWEKVGRRIAVKVGKRGLAWGRGLHHIPARAKLIKREGDKRAPAGIFRLKFAFGYSRYSTNFPYRVMSSNHKCVDDSNSKYYNKIIDASKSRKDYRSYENMRLKSNLYSYGIVVDHNPKAIKGAGSCIFMHIQKSNGKATVGCTAMRASSIKSIIKWLQPSKHPLLIQAPKSEIKKLLPLGIK